MAHRLNYGKRFRGQSTWSVRGYADIGGGYKCHKVVPTVPLTKTQCMLRLHSRGRHKRVVSLAPIKGADG